MVHMTDLEFYLPRACSAEIFPGLDNRHMTRLSYLGFVSQLCLFLADLGSWQAITVMCALVSML